MAYEHERHEWRMAVNTMTEAQRAAACGHTNRTGHDCPDCGDPIDN